MKLVYIANAEIPSKSANSINIMKMCQAFSLNDHDVTLIVPDKNNDKNDISSGAEVFGDYGVAPCFRIVKLPWFNNLKGKTYLYALHAAFYAKRLNPDLIYSRFIGACYVSTLLGMPCVFEAHMPAADFGRIEARLCRRLAGSPRLRRLIVISAALRNDYLNRYPGLSAKIIVAHDGADPVTTVTSSPDAATSDTAAPHLQVGYLGQLYPGKGIELIIALARQCPWAGFHIVGGYPEDITRWQSQIGQDGHASITFHGHVPHGRTAVVLAGFDVVLAPYQQRVQVYGGGGDIAQWMSPLKIFEYMAAGKAIVCSRLPVLEEILQDGETAWLCAPDDIGQWRQALLTLRDDALLRRRLGEAAQSEFLQRYTWQARARYILAGLAG